MPIPSFPYNQWTFVVSCLIEGSFAKCILQSPPALVNPVFGTPPEKFRLGTDGRSSGPLSTDRAGDLIGDTHVGVGNLGCAVVGVGCVEVSGYIRMTTRLLVWRPDLQVLGWRWFGEKQ